MLTILTDSTADLPRDLIDRHQIKVIPLYVLLENKSYLDGVEIGIQDLFKFVSQTGQLPKTSASSVADFSAAFDQPGEHLYIGISSKLSATNKNALLAQEALNKPGIYIIDSLNLCSGIGLLVLKAAELRDQGLPAAQITERIQSLVPKVRTSFVIETLDYLYKGGRCSAIQNIVGSLLHIRPVIQVRGDGTLGVKDRIRGSRQKALASLLDDFRAHLSEIDLQRVFVTHTGCDADASYLKEELLKIAPIQEVPVTYAGSVIASHCGPDTIGILYLDK
jgi:DegV family protein with EDD domain